MTAQNSAGHARGHCSYNKEIDDLYDPAKMLVLFENQKEGSGGLEAG